MLGKKVKNLLFRNGLGYAWIHQEVGSEVESPKSFVQRLSEVYSQKWFSDINDSPNLAIRLLLATVSSKRKVKFYQTLARPLPFILISKKGSNNWQLKKFPKSTSQHLA